MNISHEYKSEIHELKIERMENTTMFLEIDVIAPKNLDRNHLLCDMIEKDYIIQFNYL